MRPAEDERHPDPASGLASGQRTSLTRVLVFGLGWLAAIAVMLRPAPRDMAETLPNDLGDPNFLSWTLQWGSRALVEDPASVFDAPIFWPTDQTLGLSDTMLTFAPVHGAFELVTGNTVLSLNLLSLSMYLLSLVSTYLLGRWLLSGTLPAVTMALAFAFTSFSLGQQSHVQLLAFGLFPLAILLLLRYLDRGTWADAAALSAVTVAFAYSVVYYALLWVLVAPAIVVVLVALGLRVPWAVVRRGLVTLLVGALVCAPLGLLYVDVSGEHGLVRNYDGIDRLLPRDLWTPAADNWLWGSSLDSINSAGVPGDHGFMMSLVAYLCAAGALVALWRTRGRPEVVATGDGGRVDRAHAVWAVLLAGIGSFVVGLGPTVAGVPAPYRLLYRLVPGFDGIRVSSRLAIVGFLAVALLAAMGVGLLARRLRDRPGWIALGVPIVLVGLMMLEVATVGSARVDAWDQPAVVAVYDELDRRPPGVVLELPIKSGVDLFEWPFVEAPRMALAVEDGNPRINGYSGHWPNGFVEDARILSTFPETAGLERARELGVRYVIVHGTSPWPPVQITEADVDRIIDGLPDGVTAERYGSSWLVDLGPAAPDGDEIER